MTDGRLRDSISVDLSVLDTTIRLHSIGQQASVVAEAVRRAWVRCLGDFTGAPDVTLRLGLNIDMQKVDLVADELAVLMHRLSPLVTMRAIDHQAGRLLMLHAAGLAHPETGETVALVAPSGTGKTTAAVRLGRDWGYVTDETVGIRPNGTIAPYSKPLSLVRGGSSDPVKDQVPPTELDLLPLPETCHLSAIAVLARDESSDLWVEEVPLLYALARLGPESSYLAGVERPLHRLAGAVENAGGLKVLHYGDSAQLPDAINTLLRFAP